jgi:hypothetical protein
VGDIEAWLRDLRRAGDPPDTFYILADAATHCPTEALARSLD